MREELNLHLCFTNKTDEMRPPWNFLLLWCQLREQCSLFVGWISIHLPVYSENVDHDALRSPSKLPVESREHGAACFWFGFPFSCHSHVDHVALRLALLLVIHQPWYDFIERKLSPSRSTQHVCDGEKWAVICRDVVDEKSAERLS